MQSIISYTVRIFLNEVNSDYKHPAYF